MRSDASGNFKFIKDQIGALNKGPDIKNTDQYFNTVLMEVVNKSDKDFVFFFDNVDELIRDPMSKKKKDFSNFIEQLLVNSPKVKVLLTSCYSLGCTN